MERCANFARCATTRVAVNTIAAPLANPLGPGLVAPPLTAAKKPKIGSKG